MAYSLAPLPRYASLDGFAVALLTAIALAGLQPTFSGWNWVAVAALGMAVGLGWAYALAALRLGPAMVVLTLFIPYVLTAGAFALGEWGDWFGIPDSTTLGQVVTGTGSSWAQLVGTLPPLDSEGAVMLIPYLLAMAAGGLSGSLAITSPRPSLPVVPLVAVLGAALVLGTAEPFSVALQGLGFGAATLLWIGHRSARSAASLGSLRRLRGRLPVGPRRRWAPLTEAERRLTTVSTPRTLASVLCVAVAVAVVLPMASSSPSRTRWVLREALPAYDTSGTTTPLTVFRNFRPVHEPTIGNEVLFSVDGVPDGTMLRIAVLDGYNGTSWYAVPDRADDYEDRFLRISSQITNPSKGRKGQARITVEHAWLLDWLPVVGQPQAIEFLRDPDRKLRNGVRFNRSTDAAITEKGVKVGDSYLVTSLLPKDTLTPQMKQYRSPDWELHYAAEFLDAPVQVMSDRSKPPMVRLFQLADWLYIAGRYSDGDPGWQSRFVKGHDAERLGKGFVEAPQIVGNDEQYAAAMALMANRLGIPARVVVGAEISGRGVVRGRDIQAWVEVRVRDGSWRRLPTQTFMSDTPPDQIDPPKQSLPNKWNQEPPDSPEEIKRKERERREEEEAEEERERAEQRRPFYLLGLVPVLVVGAIPVAKLVRRRRRGSRSDPDVVALAGWAEVVDTATDLGLDVPRRPRPDQARALDVDVALAERADVATFTDEAPEVAGHWTAVRAATAQLRERAPWWRRWLAPFNPRSLLRRGPR
ncbi:MAG: DUF3488 and transglutaminase-like domain-containing protein [Nocardioides sp.]|uniref:DUF3488 and transglutaminase-like domain-containing protein n=1 Tax=Nocardioides sp. TaxID=35761 RepID=UPI003F0B8FEF